MRCIQQQLLRDGAYLIGRGNEDANDLARLATITASSEQPEGLAFNVISGQTRAEHGAGGAPENRANPGTHRWMSDPAQGLPQWIELHWDQPVTVGLVELTFDTGMHRVLTFSHSNAYTATMQWGQPQSETVRHYRIETEESGCWSPVAEVHDVYQRRAIHAFESRQVQTLRVTIEAMNGLNHARICEIRVYAT